METGLVDKWLKASLNEKECQLKPVSPYPFGLTHIKSALLVLCIGLGLAGGALIVELIVHKTRQHWKC